MPVCGCPVFARRFSGLRRRDPGRPRYDGGGAPRRVSGGLAEVAVQEEDAEQLLQQVD